MQLPTDLLSLEDARATGDALAGADDAVLTANRGRSTLPFPAR